MQIAAFLLSGSATDFSLSFKFHLQPKDETVFSYLHEAAVGRGI
jgi:hypothetical protein